ncbi:MAG: DNA-processing protein DprA [Candidatus Eisenbacteria sp.]|nr:DNA-processing protein DprA [Candidatus Eisenbacteria bacterium]
MDAGRSWLALSLIPGFGGRVGKMLLEAFGSPDRILNADRVNLEAVHGIGSKLSLAIRKGADNGRLQEEICNLEQAGAVLLGMGDERYPWALGKIHDPPPVLYLLGQLLELEKPRVAVVGTRRPTDSGLAFARELARDLALAGVEVVSGLAYGIDSAAHMGALEGQGTTVAVLGCGVDVLYPRRRGELRDRIQEKGTLVSEFPMRTTPLPEYFPRRNRIISGLSSVVVVVEAASRSGALLTADLALEQGREVMAVPGYPKSRLSEGPNRLLQEGAKLVLSAEDVLEELPVLRMERDAAVPPVPRPPEPEGVEERKILGAVRSGARLVDEIAQATGFDVSVILNRLLGMELRGLVRRIGGARYEQVAH